MSQQLYRQNSYRNTATHQAGRVPTATMPDLDFSQPAKAAQKMVEHADGMTNALVDEMEYSASLVEENRIFNIVQNASAEFLRRSNIADGLKDSWYDEQGVFREKDFKEWENEQYNLLSQTPTSAFIRPESKMKARQNAMDTRQKLNKQFTAALAADVPRRTQERFKKSIDAHLLAGDYNGATELTESNPNMSPADKEYMKREIWLEQEKNWIKENKNDPRALRVMRADKKYYDSLSPELQVLLNEYSARAERTIAEEEKELQEQREKAVEKAKKMNTEATEEAHKLEAAANKAAAKSRAPKSAPSYIVEHFEKYKGEFKNNLSAQDEGINLLTLHARNIISKPGDIDDLNELKDLAKSMEIADGEAAGRIYNQVCDELRNAGALPVRKIVDSLPQATLLTNNEVYTNYANDYQRLTRLNNQIRGIDAKLLTNISGSDATKLKELRGQLKAQRKDIETIMAEEAGKVRKDIEAEFDSWMKEGGQNQTTTQQAAYLAGVINKATRQKEVALNPNIQQTVLTAQKESDAKREEAAKRNQEFEAKHSEYLKQRKQKEEEENKKQEEIKALDVTSNVYIDSNNDLPESSSKNRVFVPQEFEIPHGSLIKYATAQGEITVEIMHHNVDSIHVSSRLADIIKKNSGYNIASIFIKRGYLIADDEEIPSITPQEEAANVVEGLLPDDNVPWNNSDVDSDVPIDPIDIEEDDTETATPVNESGINVAN